jgi:ABC-2 type transport system permease protein
MIRTLLRIHMTNLRRDRAAQILTFLVPMAFFTVFALVFGGSGRSTTPKVAVAVVDEAGSAVSARLVRALAAEPGLRVRTTAPRDQDDTTRVPLDRPRAEALVRDGAVPVAIVLPAGLDSAFGLFGGADGPTVTVLNDPSDPIASQVVNGLLQKVAMTAMPDLLADQGLEAFARYAGPLTPGQRGAVDHWLPALRARAGAGGDRAGTAAGDSTGGASLALLRTRVVDVLGRREDRGMIEFYAAGIAVMFLLFSASGSAGTLLDEVDSGTLDRVLSSRVGMTGLLAGKWLHIMLVGILQIVAMFVYGWLVFRLDLPGHLPGFGVMTAVTAATAAAFGLMLATLCRTRAQLGAFSTLVIMILSALGGSMFPRFMMSEGMQRLGLLTFNAWALDGYIKVFWREAPLQALLPQIAGLSGFAVAFLAIARLAARRWEQA